MFKKIVVPAGSSVPIKFAEQTGSVKQYETDFNSFLFFRGIPIGLSAIAIDSTQTLYQVPDGYYLFLTSLSLGYSNFGGTAGGGVQLKMHGETFILLPTQRPQYETGLIVLPFTIPFKLEPKERILVQSDTANQSAIGSFAGFLVKI